MIRSKNFAASGWLFMSWSLAVGLLLLLGLSGLLIQSLSRTAFASTSETTLTGWFTVIWGDPKPGSTEMGETTYWLTDDQGTTTRILLDSQTARAAGGITMLDRQRVTLAGGSVSLSTPNATPLLRAKKIQVAVESAQPTVQGAQPWVSIACKFADVSAEPKTTSYFQGMYSSNYPGLDHYWREQSYNQINLSGSSTVGWYTLPHPRAYYIYDRNSDGVSDLDFDRAADDCTAVANANVNFTNYTGINLMFNTDLDCCAWGGGHYMTLDGTSKVWGMTWLPPWGYENLGAIEHEMGHGFGLPHSSVVGGLGGNVWDVMSMAMVYCQLSTDQTYGCLGNHTISYHKDKLGWISNTRKYVAAPGTQMTITLEQLAQPQTSNYEMAQVPISNSTTHFYTVEVRRTVGYDLRLPGQGVIIHEVDTTSDTPAYLVDVDKNGNTGDNGAIWLPGEHFVDAQNKIAICINSANATSYAVTVASGVIPDCALIPPTPTATPTTPPGEIHARGAVTWDSNMNPKSVFMPNEQIYYIGQFHNSNDSVQTGYVTWSVVGPCGSIFSTGIPWDFDLGDTDGGFRRTIPSGACGGNYRFTIAVTYNGITSNAFTDFTINSTVTPPGTATSTPTPTSTPTVPQNDDWNNALNILVMPYNDNRSTTRATIAQDDPPLCRLGGDAQGSHTVWYKYTANALGNLTIRTSGSNYDTVVGVFTGTRGNLTRAACNDDAGSVLQSLVNLTVQPGTIYYIEVADYYNVGGSNSKPNATGRTIASSSEGGFLALNVQFQATRTNTPTFSPTPTATPCAAKPDKPMLLSPNNRAKVKVQSVPLDWQDSLCSSKYIVMVKEGNKNGTKVDKKTVLMSRYTTKTLSRGKNYWWSVKACNLIGCAKSEWRSFKIK